MPSSTDHAVRHLTLSNAIHKSTFWVAVIGAVISVAIAAGFPITAAQATTIETAVGLLASFVLGGSAVAAAHAKAAASLAQSNTEAK